jgi:import inner membrane translocase subunit TIM9
MDAFSNIPEHQKAEFIRHLEDNQMKDSLKMYNNLVENCFDKCVMVGWDGNYSSKNLTEAEGKCISVCGNKFMKLTQRVGFRFQEFQAMREQETQEKK